MEVELAAEVEAVTTSSRGWVSGVRTKGGRGHDASRNKDESRCGVYYVGASTHPGNGVPLVFKSARLVCERILEDLGPSANEM